MADCNAGLKSEELAAVDFLVLANCRSFVGFADSTFSIYVPQFQSFLGYPPSVSVFVQGSRNSHYGLNSRIADVEINS